MPFEVMARDLVVFAAASLKETVDQIAADFGDTVVSYGGSGTLARQISLGAPADVVVLAHPRWMDTLDEEGLMASRATIAANSLVLIGPTPDTVDLTPHAIAARLGDGRLALGATRAVPAGIYGQQAIEELGLWDGLEGRLAETDSVRAALALVARGEVPLGLVYATDARVSDQVHIVARVSGESHAPIIYEAGHLQQSDHPDAAAFVAALQGSAAQQVFRQAGFRAPE